MFNYCQLKTGLVWLILIQYMYLQKNLEFGNHSWKGSIMLEFL